MKYFEKNSQTLPILRKRVEFSNQHVSKTFTRRCQW